jgi:hypothetical protein
VRVGAIPFAERLAVDERRPVSRSPLPPAGWPVGSVDPLGPACLSLWRGWWVYSRVCLAV